MAVSYHLLDHFENRCNTSVFNQNGGTCRTVVLEMAISSSSANATYNLNGGTLATESVYAGGGTSTFNFNGGTLQDFYSSSTGYFQGFTTANVRNGGAIIDTNGFNITVAQPLVHSTVAGDNVIDGGLTKVGAGTLTLTGANTYTGVTNISAGTLLVDAPQSSVRQVTVQGSSAVLGGNSILAAPIFVSLGGINPGNNAGAGGSAGNVGTLTTGTLTLTSQAVATFDVDTSTFYDELAANGSVTLDDATLALDVNSSTTFMLGQVLDLIHANSGILSGTFAGIDTEVSTRSTASSSPPSTPRRTSSCWSCPNRRRGYWTAWRRRCWGWELSHGGAPGAAGWRSPEGELCSTGKLEGQIIPLHRLATKPNYYRLGPLRTACAFLVSLLLTKRPHHTRQPSDGIMKTPRCSALQPVPGLSLILALLVAAGLGPGITPYSHAQTLLNGRFELPGLGSGNEAYGAGDDWTAILAYVDTNGEDIGTTPYGTQWVDLWPTATVSQTISSGFTLNQVYALSMACSDAFGYAYDDLLVTVSGGGIATPAISSFAIPENTNLYNQFPFITYSVTFTPMTSDPVTITLGNLGQTTEGFLALDNVVLSGPSVVPEASTWALMAGGAALLCVLLRRRTGRV